MFFCSISWQNLSKKACSFAKTEFLHKYSSRILSVFEFINVHFQPFMNYIVLYTRNRARKAVLGVPPSTWEIMHAKELACTLLIILWYDGWNCTKLVLKLLPLKMASLFQPCVLLILFKCTWWLPSILVHYAIYLHNSVTIFDKLKWEAVQRI